MAEGIHRRGWIAPSLGFILIVFFLMFIAAPQVTNFVPFSGSFRKPTVCQCKTDPGRRRERSGACASAVPMGCGAGMAPFPLSESS